MLVSYLEYLSSCSITALLTSLEGKRVEDSEDKGTRKRKGKGVPLTLHAISFFL